MVCTGREKKPCGTCVHCDKATRGVHPDITAVDLAEGKREITVDQIRALRDDTVVCPTRRTERSI
jgi:DNA polymerase III gamma/tau subunit